MYAKLNKFEEDMGRKGRGQSAFDSMLSRFNKSLEEYGLFRELKERRSYVKPSNLRSKKKLNKKIKARRENAVYQKRIQGYTEQGYQRTSRDTKTHQVQ